MFCISVWPQEYCFVLSRLGSSGGHSHGVASNYVSEPGFLAVVALPATSTCPIHVRLARRGRWGPYRARKKGHELRRRWIWNLQQYRRASMVSKPPLHQPQWLMQTPTTSLPIWVKGGQSRAQQIHASRAKVLPVFQSHCCLNTPFNQGCLHPFDAQ